MSELEGLKGKSKSALRQCLRHCVRKGLRPLDPKRDALAKVERHGIKRVTSSGALHGHLPLTRQNV